MHSNLEETDCCSFMRRLLKSVELVAYFHSVMATLCHPIDSAREWFKSISTWYTDCICIKLIIFLITGCTFRPLPCRSREEIALHLLCCRSSPEIKCINNNSGACIYVIDRLRCQGRFEYLGGWYWHCSLCPFRVGERQIGVSPKLGTRAPVIRNEQAFKRCHRFAKNFALLFPHCPTLMPWKWVSQPSEEYSPVKIIIVLLLFGIRSIFRSTELATRQTL